MLECKENLIPVNSVWLPWYMPKVHVAWGLSHHYAGIFFCFEVIYVIVKMVTPCFHMPSLLSSSLVGQCTEKTGKYTIHGNTFEDDNLCGYRVCIISI